MEDYRRQLEQQVEQVDQLIASVEKRLANTKNVKKQKIRISVRKNGFQYYRLDDTGKRIYVKRDDMQLVKSSVQRDYDEITMDALRTVRYRIERFLKLYNPYAVEEIYNRLCDARKILIDPIIPTDEVFVRNWRQAHAGGQNEYPAETTYLTDSGESVRSKSEKILADMFLKYEIPYCYEPRLEFNNGKVVYPDFALLNIRTRKTIFWEHFGLISDGEYASHALEKLNAYEASGYIAGDNLLYSMESERMPLDVRTIEEKVRQYLL